MVAFKFPVGKSISLSEEYLVPLGLGDCTIANDLLYADLPLSDRQIKAIEAGGFERADTEYYAISPEPEPWQRGALVKAFESIPCTTILKHESLEVAFAQPLNNQQIAAVQNLGFQIKKLG